MAKRSKSVVICVLGVLMLAGAIGCSGKPLTTREKGTIAGGGLGAATGAIIGAATGAPGVGAALGGVLGAGGGFLVGNALQNNEIQESRAQGRLVPPVLQFACAKERLQYHELTAGEKARLNALGDGSPVKIELSIASWAASKPALSAPEGDRALPAPAKGEIIFDD